MKADPGYATSANFKRGAFKLDKPGLSATADNFNVKPAQRINNMIVEEQSNAAKSPSGGRGLRVIGQNALFDATSKPG